MVLDEVQQDPHLREEPNSNRLITLKLDGWTWDFLVVNVSAVASKLLWDIVSAPHLTARQPILLTFSKASKSFLGSYSAGN